MALRRKVATEPSQALLPRPRSLIASAIRTNISDLSYNLWKFRDESWQRELWRYYDIIPEFSFAARWVGNCCSKVRIYVADVDKYGRVQGEAKDVKINSLADSLLGGPAAKAESLRGLGINLTVSGEAYIIGRPGDPSSEDGPPKDEWFVLSSSEMRRVQNDDGQWQWAWVMPNGEPFMKLDLKRNVVTRVWTPHPARVWCADSPARACMAALRQLEQLVKHTFSQIDSRLFSAGLLVIPSNLDMPQEPNTTNVSESLMMKIAQAGAASLRGEGSALGVLPHIIESDNPDGFKLVSFEAALSAVAKELREEAVNRLGVGLDMPPEILNGLGSENHWNAFLIDGYGIKVHIEPLMNRICDALTKAYLIPALRLMGKDPSRYTYAYDTSPLALRPQRLQDALNLYEKGMLSEEAVRNAGFFKESDAPDVDEDVERFLREMMMRDGSLLQNQAVREAAGIPEEIISQEDMIAAMPMDPAMLGMAPPPGQEGGGPPPPPIPPTGIQSELPPPIPETLDQVGQFQPPNGIQASAVRHKEQQMEDLRIAVVAEATVLRSLEVAGKRLLDKEARNRFSDVPAYELHTRIKVKDRAHVNRLLLGAWDHLGIMVSFVAPNFDTTPLRDSLEEYCSWRLLSGNHHDPQQLLDHLRKDGVISAS